MFISNHCLHVKVENVVVCLNLLRMNRQPRVAPLMDDGVSHKNKMQRALAL